MSSLKEIMISQSKELESKLTKIRRHLHKHPELSLKEYETAHYIEKQLTTLGIPYERVGETGVVAHIKGEKSTDSTSVPTIGLRADIDALPIREQTDLPFSSINEGVMHACGHDGHTTILLGAAELLYKNRKHIPGNILCVFQHAEEEGDGAKEMVELGIIENYNVSAFMGLHLWPHLPLGTIGVRTGSMTAACDDFDIEVMGKSGHSARPQEGIDALSIAFKIIEAMQYIKATSISPLDSSIIHIGQINGGDNRNVIADHVTLKGTVRTLSPKIRRHLAKEINRLTQGIGKMYGAKTSLNYEYGPAPITNDAFITQIIKESSETLWGNQKVVELLEPSLGADDFGEFAQQVPSSYFRLGIQDEDHYHDLHHPKFSFDEKILPIGAVTFAHSAINAITKMEES